MASNLDIPSLYKVDGQGLKLLDIVNEYINLMEDDYNLTVDDLAYYIGCGRDYVVNSLKQHIKHIRINTVVREAIKEYQIKDYISISDQTYMLFMKRILFSQENFKRFILENCKVQHQYKKLKFEEFNFEVDSVRQKDELIHKLNDISYKLFGECTEPVIKSIDYMPKKLYSMKELKQIHGLNYNVEFYRFTYKFAVNKIKLFNNVRYDIEDFETGNDIIVNYSKYEELGRKMVIDSILKSLR